MTTTGSGRSPAGSYFGWLALGDRNPIATAIPNVVLQTYRSPYGVPNRELFLVVIPTPHGGGGIVDKSRKMPTPSASELSSRDWTLRLYCPHRRSEPYR